MTAMIRAGGLRGFEALVHRLGGDPGPLLRRHRIESAALQDEDALIPLRALMLLLEDSATVLDCADFGLQLAQSQDISILGPVAVAIQHSATAAEALANASRYLFVHSPAIAFSVLPSSPIAPELAELRFEVTMPDLPHAPQGTDLSLGVAHRMIQLLARQHYRLQAVCLPHRPAAPLARYVQHFGAPVRTDTAHAALLIPPVNLQVPLTEADATLRQLAANYLDVHFSAPGETVAARVRLALRRSLGTGQTGRTQIARTLLMHPRTLQRHLAREGTSFEVIRDAVCREAAHRYLTASSMPMSQIAGLIGLSEQSAFTRACRRWFGMPPSAVRRAAGDGGSRA